MPRLIPLTPSEPFYSFTTTLEDVDYLFDVRWNAIDGAWYFDVSTVSEEPILPGIKIVLGASPGRLCIDPRFPPGAFFVVDTTGQGVDAGFDDIGTRVQLHYYTSAEVAAF